jgi:hypothetical protein
MAILLIPLCRGRRGGSSGRGGVENGGLSLPENGLEGDGAVAANGSTAAVLCRRW